jgi:hypothetical protein
MCVSVVVRGQGMMGGQPQDLGEHLAKLFGKKTAFSANAEMPQRSPLHQRPDIPE